MRRDFDVVIVGAGIVGCTLACLLTALEVCSPERIALLAEVTAPVLPASDWDLRVFALSRASERALQCCDIWRRLPAQRRHPYERMVVWDASGNPGGRSSIEFDCADIGEANLGHIVDGRQLLYHCYERAAASGAAVIGAQLAAVTAGRVLLGDGQELTAQLIVAADGADSRARELLGVRTAGHSYEQEALVAHVRTALPHRDTAWQRFTETGPLAFLPLDDGRSSIVWSSSRPSARRLASLDPGSFAVALSEASAGVLGECELATGIARFPLKLQYALDYVVPGAALVGDAAHSVHPLAGQGLNIGLMDCATLAEVLRERRRGDRLGDMRVLRAYERRRRGGNFLMASALDGLERLFGGGGAALSGARGVALGTASRVPALKREFARRALGLTGDVPHFLTGAGG